MRFFSALVVCLLALSPSISKADFVIAVTAGGSTYHVPGTPNSVATTVAGHTVTMGVWIYDSGDVNRTITSYELGFDLGISPIGGLDGKNNSIDFATVVDTVGVSFNSSLPYSNAPNATSFSVLSADATNYDVSVAGTLDSPYFPVAGSAAPVRLFNIQIQTKQSSTAGLYSFSLVPLAKVNGILGEADLNFVNIVNLDVVSTVNSFVALGGQFRITAVPEPSSLALVGLVSVGMCLARRRRRASV